jgi:hypothetical protein
MLYTKKELLKLLQDKNVATTAKSVAQLLIIALDNGVVTREDILAEPKDVPKLKVQSVDLESIHLKKLIQTRLLIQSMSVS